MSKFLKHIKSLNKKNLNLRAGGSSAQSIINFLFWASSNVKYSLFCKIINIKKWEILEFLLCSLEENILTIFLVEAKMKLS